MCGESSLYNAKIPRRGGYSVDSDVLKVLHLGAPRANAAIFRQQGWINVPLYWRYDLHVTALKRLHELDAFLLVLFATESRLEVFVCEQSL